MYVHNNQLLGERSDCEIVRISGSFLKIKSSVLNWLNVIDCLQELKIIAELLGVKYGHQYIEACRTESVGTISEKLKHKLSIQSPAKLLVEKYLVEIANSYNLPYEPDPQVMNEENGNYCFIGHFNHKLKKIIGYRVGCFIDRS